MVSLYLKNPHPSDLPLEKWSYGKLTRNSYEKNHTEFTYGFNLLYVHSERKLSNDRDYVSLSLCLRFSLFSIFSFFQYFVCKSLNLTDSDYTRLWLKNEEEKQGGERWFDVGAPTSSTTSRGRLGHSVRIPRRSKKGKANARRMTNSPLLTTDRASKLLRTFNFSKFTILLFQSVSLP